MGGAWGEEWVGHEVMSGWGRRGVRDDEREGVGGWV